MGLVLAAAVSGAEALVMGASHARRIDACICKKLRCMMLGAAHIGDEEGGHYSLPSVDVWRESKLVPYAIETCVRRLKWWQQIVAEPARNQHLILVFFGQLPHETEDQVLDPQGVIRDDAHPWAVQLAADLEEMLTNVEDAYTLSQIWQPRSIPRLFNDPEIKDAFCQIDATAIRARFLSKTWSPQSDEMRQSVPPEGEVAEGTQQERLFTCDICDEGGKTCGKKFASNKGLLMHQRFSKLANHGHRTWLSKLCPTNMCIMCGTCFSSKKNSLDHMTRSWKQGRCIKENTALPHSFIPPRQLRCGVCSFEADDWPTLKKTSHGASTNDPSDRPVQRYGRHRCTQRSWRCSTARRRADARAPRIGRCPGGHGGRRRRP